MSYSWLITGASSGLGACLAIAALKAGHKVVATARNVDKARADNPDVEKLGGTWMRLDVVDLNTEALVAEAVKKHSVNVVVNNAGYAQRGVAEANSVDDYKKQLDANFYGAIAVTKGALPTFRANKAGQLLFVSSVAGVRGTPGYSAYSASKWAMEGFAESLSHEVAPFGIRVLIVQPGGFRTQFQVNASHQDDFVPPAYQGTIAQERLRMIRGSHGAQPGDPERAAVAMLQAVTGEGAGKACEGQLRLPLGKDAMQVYEAKVHTLQDTIAKVGGVAESAAYD